MSDCYSKGDIKTSPARHLETSIDAQGSRKKRILPDGREQRVEYDAVGRSNETAFASNSGTCGSTAACVVLTSAYDGAGRRESLSGSTSGTQPGHYAGTITQIWEYDSLGRLLEESDDNGTGHDAVVRYTWDALSRKTSEGCHEAAGAARWDVVSEYNTAGPLEKITYPDHDIPHRVGADPDLVWDDLGRLNSLSEAGDAEPIHQNANQGSTRVCRWVRQRSPA